jgi:hypothetical protein
MPPTFARNNGGATMTEAFQISVLEGELRFGALCYEHIIGVPEYRREHIHDIRIAIHGNPTQKRCVQDVHFYLNEYDLTEALKTCFRKEIDMANKTGDLSKGYAERLEDWIELEKKLVQETPPEQFDFYSGCQTTISKEEDKRDEFLKLDPLSANLDTLGDTSAGWNGNLHIFNYIYKYLPLNPVSLNDVWGTYLEIEQNFPEQTPKHWSQIRSVSFVVSAGARMAGNAFWEPPGLYIPLSGNVPWQPYNEPPTGDVNYHFEMLYHDPLVDEVNQLRTDLEDLAKLVKDRLETILDEVGPEGRIQKELLKPMSDKIKEIDIRLGEANSEISDMKTRIVRIKEMVKEVHAVLEP